MVELCLRLIEIIRMQRDEIKELKLCKTEKGCTTCKHRDKSLSENPCFKCTSPNFEMWEMRM